MAETLLESIGGPEGCRKLASSFYGRVDREPLLRPFFPGKTHKCAIEEMSAFLVQLLGGPADKTQRRWWLSLRESHARFTIGGHHRDAWMTLMSEALDEADFSEPARTALRHFFEEASAYIVNQDHGHELSGELSHRWKVQRELDAAVAAIRSGEAPALDSFRPSVIAGLLAMMIRSGDSRLMQHAREEITRAPSLARERHAGRTLLHDAAAAGDATTVSLLLRLGIDPDVQDAGRHTPLYSVANECAVPGGGDVVRLLVEAGAKVDACAGVKRCTPLHMAARRGNVGIAQALLAFGADSNAQDSKGDTPLKRALNCRKPAVAALLATAG